VKKRLVILTTDFGANFSGGSTATCEIFSRLEDHLEEIVVVAARLGDHPFDTVKFLKYEDWFHAVRILRGLSNSNTIFYGDFYNSFLFIVAGVQFHFTYHDNWPELGKRGIFNGLRSFFYTSIYKAIFRKAKSVVTVSKFKHDYVKRYAVESHLIFNGFNRSHSSDGNLPNQETKSILMVGNIDRRKYDLAIPLFKKIASGKKLIIDIYGNTVDCKLANELDKFSFVNMKGFVKSIPYSSYRLLLHTSISESFGMVFCEAIFHGLPVLTFEEGGARELIGSDNGVLVKPYDVDQMYESLLKMLEGHMTVDPASLEQYSWEHASESYLKKLELG